MANDGSLEAEQNSSKSQADVENALESNVSKYILCNQSQSDGDKSTSFTGVLFCCTDNISSLHKSWGLFCLKCVGDEF